MIQGRTLPLSKSQLVTHRMGSENTDPPLSSQWPGPSRSEARTQTGVEMSPPDHGTSRWRRTPRAEVGSAGATPPSPCPWGLSPSLKPQSSPGSPPGLWLIGIPSSSLSSKGIREAWEQPSPAWASGSRLGVPPPWPGPPPPRPPGSLHRCCPQGHTHTWPRTRGQAWP